MADTNIEWASKVWNPTTGCNKVSSGCKNCYAEKMHKRLQKMSPAKYNRPFLDGAFPHEASLFAPMKWKKPTTIFVNSMSDLFHENIPVDYIARVYAVMFLTPQHTYQVLTKRPDRRVDVFRSQKFQELLWRYMRFYNPDPKKEIEFTFPFDNIWEGTSIEDQATANERYHWLMATPAAVRWISMEPMLSAIDLQICVNMHWCVDITKSQGLDWLVLGGESGPKRRRFDPEWARAIRDYCRASGIPFFMKQIDKKIPIPADLMIREYPLNWGKIERAVKRKELME